MLFFQLSLTQTLIWGVGIFLVSHILSLEYVTIYSLNMKIYIYILYAYIIVNTVIAPLYGRYFADNSWKDIERIFNLMLLLLPFLGGFIWIGTLYFMSDIIALWTGSQEFYIGSLFVLLMGSFFYFTGYVNSYITLLYSKYCCIFDFNLYNRLKWSSAGDVSGYIFDFNALFAKMHRKYG